MFIKKEVAALRFILTRQSSYHQVPYQSPALTQYF